MRVALVAYGFFVEFQEPPTVADFIAVSRAIGSGIGSLLISAVIPVLIWGGAKIISRPIGFPVILWIALGTGLTYFAELGRRADRELQRDQRETEFTDGDRALFKFAAQLSCMRSQRDSEINKAAGLTEQQIVHANRIVPQSMMPKSAQAAPQCSQALTQN